MTPERVTEAFGRMGGSWKRATPFSEKEQRPLHGRAGRGRLRVFALGNLVRWTSVADAADGRRLRTIVTSASPACTEFEISEPEATDEPCGTRVEAWGKQSPYLRGIYTQARSRGAAGEPPRHDLGPAVAVNRAMQRRNLNPPKGRAQGSAGRPRS